MNTTTDTAAAQLQGITVGAGIRERVRRELEADDKLTQSRIAKEAGTNKTALSLYLNEKPVNGLELLEGKLVRWLATRGERAAVAAALPTQPEFCETQTALDLVNSFKLAQALPDLVLALAAPGSGKTTTARQYQRQSANVWVATLAAHTTGVVPVLRAIQDAVGADSGSGASGLAASIVRRIRDTGGLLIVDEAHHASVAALDALRALHDAAEVGLVLLGDMTLAAKVEDMPQLSSRCGIRFHRPRILAEDVDTFLDAWGITDPASREVLAAMASRSGGLRSVNKTIRLALLTAGEGEGLTLQRVQDAAATLAA